MHGRNRCGATSLDRVCLGHRFNWEIIEMRKLILVGALALLVLSPLTAVAQQRATPSPSPAAPSALEGVSTAKVLAIGFGALLGAVAANALEALRSSPPVILSEAKDLANVSSDDARSLAFARDDTRVTVPAAAEIPFRR
jgi:hypothetical protein